MGQSLQEYAGLLRAADERVHVKIKFVRQSSIAASYFHSRDSYCKLHKPSSRRKCNQPAQPLSCAGISCPDDISSTRRAPLYFLVESEQKR